MSLNKEFFNRKTNIAAKVVCDSVSPDGVRLTTFELEYPRFIHSEIMTHRSLSKNSSSSRAIPISKMLQQIEDNMALPVYWGKNKSGMQAVEEVNAFAEVKSVLNWERSFNYTKERVEDMVEIGLHKQVPNRLLEPFQMMKIVITGADWDNFFNLRIHPDAQPEICMLAYKMYDAMQNSSPNKLQEGEWHLPYVTTEVWGNSKDREIKYFINKISKEFDQSYGMKYEEYMTLEEAVKYSSACCASVSYRTEGMTLEKADKIFDMLVKAEVIHASPFEHLATPVRDQTGNVNGLDEGITHTDRYGNLYSGNLRGWVQYRHLLTNNTCWDFDFDERMKLFED